MRSVGIPLQEEKDTEITEFLGVLILERIFSIFGI